MGTRNGFLGSEKEAAAAECECDDGLGLRMQQANRSFSFPHRKMMLTPHQYYNHHHHHHPYHEHLDHHGGSGSMFCNTSNNQVGCLSDIYDVVSAGGAARTSTLQHPFMPETSIFNSSGMASSVTVPFTAAQWQELERQTMIYKYMLASLPVPPELLLPISKPPSNMRKGCLELGISSSVSDPEPWRCRRTDGKKWRCSRDVVPDQKYCERHSHKTRPRSRKPVEMQPNFLHNTTTNNVATKPCQKTQFLNQDYQMSSFPSPPVSAASHEQPRDLEWFMKGEHLNSYGGLRAGHGLLLSPKLASFEGAANPNQGQETRHFIDAWSPAERDTNMSEIGTRNSVSSNGKSPLSSLTLSMSGGNETKEEDTRILKPQWMSPVSWMSSPPGGPLGEALCLGFSSNAKAASNIAMESPHGYSTSSTSTSKSSGGNGSQGLNFIN